MLKLIQSKNEIILKKAKEKKWVSIESWNGKIFFLNVTWKPETTEETIRKFNNIKNSE